MNDNVLTSYSFLAALSENETDIYKTVYLPLFKRAISSYAAKKSSKYNPQIEMFARFKMKSSFHKTKRII